MASGSSEPAAATLDSASDQLTGNIKAVPAMHIYNLCLGRGKLPSFILDIRSSEDFDTLHLINSFNCHIESPFVTVEEIERIIKSSASLSQRLRSRENFVIAIIGNTVRVSQAVAQVLAAGVSKEYTVFFCDAPGFNALRDQYPFMLLSSPATELPFPLKALPSEIIAGQLYLGNQWTATSDDAILALKISAVVNCAMEMDNFFEREGAHGAAAIPYLRVEIDDKQSQPLMPEFNRAIEFIYDTIKKGGRVLVHCAMGQSRAASFAIAYVMATKQLNADQATEYVRRRKGDINPNPGFVRELKQYEKVILGDGAVVCGLPVVFEGACEKKGGGPDGQRNWFKGGRRNWKERHLRLTSRWLQYLDDPGPGGVVKGSLEISPEWSVSFNSKQPNGITIESCGVDVLNCRFATLELCRKWKEVIEDTAIRSASLRQRDRASELHQ